MKLDYYYGLEAACRAYPEGGTAGCCFINGETSSIWIWDPITRCWCDANRPLQSPLAGMIDDPTTFQPQISKGVPTLYLYIAEQNSTIRFEYVKNLNTPLEVVVSHPSLIWLYWDGDQWTPRIIAVERSY